MFRLKPLGIVIAVTLFVGSGLWYRGLSRAALPGDDILKAAYRAERSTDYETRLETETRYNGRRQTATASAYYKAGGLSLIRYETPPLDGLILGNDGRRNWRYDARRRVVDCGSDSEKDSPANPRRIELLFQNYNIRWEGQDRVAGRIADIVRISRKAGGGASRRLWIDRERRIILRSDEYDSDGKLTVRTASRSVAFRPQPAHRFQPPARSVRVRQEAALRPMEAAPLSEAVGFQVLLPRYIPAGYRYEGSYLDRCRCGCGMKAAYSRYGDGLNVISVFQCAHCMGDGKPCAIIETGHSKIANIFHRQMSFVIVGDVPQGELQQMADSLP
ncbi:MAG: hypothetical protein IT210_09435 [Armatimonadetes bacterium]|nr:hypothetical protein [Armatimonadota bacterium]